MTAALSKICHFGIFLIFAYFSSKWVNIYILVVLRSSGDDFDFVDFPESRKKNEVFDDTDPVKNV